MQPILIPACSPYTPYRCKANRPTLADVGQCENFLKKYDIIFKKQNFVILTGFL